jgi:hypothetical protein
MSDTVTETFFRPDEVGRESTSVPSDIYNITHTMLSRSENDCVFVPIRSLQYLAVLTADEIVFVDSMAYVVNEGHGGRIIMIAWQFNHGHERDSLESPMACDVVYYHVKSYQVQQRLVVDFLAAIKLMDERYREHMMPASGARILKM